MASAQPPPDAAPRTAPRQRTVRFDLESGSLWLDEQLRGDNGAGQIVARDVGLQGCSATDLQHGCADPPMKVVPPEAWTASLCHFPVWGRWSRGRAAITAAALCRRW